MIGPGKYDDVCKRLVEELNAKGVVLVVLQGYEGNGFACNVVPEMATPFADMMPKLLHDVADAMGGDHKILRQGNG